ncbi:5-guanidino-2-oxopentanoate decarboxylase [Nonomuraea dietziae]|uniref:5-guanidino-2-oxopentanoate decarboxylase n=1 Tax=Nonomuraea dietziae TaxID=65515 RepID=UPI0033D2D1A7
MATESSLTGAAAVVGALRSNGVETVFGIPGTHNLELYRQLASSDIRHVAPRHEQGGGYAADAYARVSGRPGVCVTTSGPGLTNIATAAATAYADSVPLLVISPGAPLGQDRADVGWLHEVKDQRAAMDALYDRSVRVSSPAQAAAVIHETFARWRVERPRPVHLELPLDVLESPWDGAAPGPLESAALLPSAGVLARAAAALRGASTPLIVLGGGARDACAQAVRLAELLGAPVATSVSGKGVVPESHPLSLGAGVGLGPVQEAIEAADVLLVAGSELADSDLWGVRLHPRGTVIRVDVDLRQLHKNVPADIAVHGDAATVLGALAGALSDRAPGPAGGERAARVRAAAAEAAMSVGAGWRPVQEVLRDCLPEDTIVAGDSAQVSYFGTVPFWPMDAPRRFVYPTGYATLGYAVPAAIGAKLAAQDRTVIALAGDGGTLFSVQELAVAAELRLSLPVIVMNNHGYAEIREEMLARNIPPVAVDIDGIDFPALGRAFGGRGEQVADLAELPAALKRALDVNGPTVIEVTVDGSGSSATWEMAPPVASRRDTTSG